MIHASAIIDSTAKIAERVTIGPWSVIGPDVEIGAGTSIAAHVVVQGPTKIGENCRIFPFASIGSDTQDLKYRGEISYLEIGNNNTIRECVTINRGTAHGGGTTKIGNDNLLMAYVHIAHDCQIGSNTIFSNNASLAGHCVVEDWAILSGFSCAHQFCRIGKHSFLGMRSAINQDILPYCLAAGAEPVIRSINIEGLKRRGFSSDVINVLHQVYKLVFRSGLTLKDAKQQIQEFAGSMTEVQDILAFMEGSERGLLR